MGIFKRHKRDRSNGVPSSPVPPHSGGLEGVAPMDPDRFWSLFEGVRNPDDLHGRLEALDERDLVAFERQHTALHDQAYDWSLWGAAYLIHGGCSDDTFSDFRSYLFSLGRATFEQALAHPDSLADVDGLDHEGEDWEEWSSPTMTVVHRRTGEYEFAGPPATARTASSEPTGDEWDEDANDLAERFPRLTSKFG